MYLKDWFTQIRNKKKRKLFTDCSGIYPCIWFYLHRFKDFYCCTNSVEVNQILYVGLTTLKNDIENNQHQHVFQETASKKHTVNT